VTIVLGCATVVAGSPRAQSVDSTGTAIDDGPLTLVADLSKRTLSLRLGETVRESYPIAI
jgi:hypothetical protein